MGRIPTTALGLLEVNHFLKYDASETPDDRVIPSIAR